MTTATSGGAPGVGDLPETGVARPRVPRLAGPRPTSTWGRTARSAPGGNRWRPRWPASGPSGLIARRSELARLLRNEGATYNVTRDNQSRRQPWSLDPWPLVVEESEWAVLESAVAQRVRLLDLVFADLYGERRLVAGGHVPAELVLGHPAFLRACAGIADPRPRRMFLTAVDVVRDGDGRFRAIGDRAQAPSGLGYALVNRTILSRVLPTLHRESGVERLAGFFRAIRAGVAAVGPRGGRRAPGGHPDPGPAQRDLLRARLPGLLPRLRPGRGAGPGGQQQPGLAAVAGRVRPGRRGHPPGGRPVVRPGRAAGRLAAGRARPAGGGPPGPGHRAQPARLRGHREPGAGRAPRRRWPRSCSARTWPCGVRRPGGAVDPTASSHVLAHLDHLILLPVRPVAVPAARWRPRPCRPADWPTSATGSAPGPGTGSARRSSSRRPRRP